MKKKSLIVLGLFLFALFTPLGIASPVKADVIEANGTALQMVLTETGGVTLNLTGNASKYFKVWDRANNSLTRIQLPWDNIVSYDVDGDMLYFIVNSGSYTQVYQHNLSTGVSEQLTNQYTNKREVQACNGLVAWMDYGMNAIYILNMSDKQEKRIEVPPSSEVEISLTESYLAYTAHNRGGESSVMFYDLETAELSSVKGGKTIKSGIYMQGHRMVWVEGGGYTSEGVGYYNEIWGNYVQRNALNQVFMYDLWTGETKQLSNNDMNNLQPVVWENYVSWAQTRNGVPEIMLMDLSSNELEQVSNNDFYDVQPAINYGSFVYITAHGINGDLSVQSLQPAQPDSIPAANNGEISIYINGSKLSSEVQPYIAEGRTMVPIRVITENLGAQVYWDPEKYAVEIFKGNTSIHLTIGNTTAYVNGAASELQAPPEINQDRTMVPLRFVGEALKCTVSWNGEARSVLIRS